MGLNTAASISFSQINSTSYFTNGNLGINTTNPTANLDVAGTINASGLSSLASITTGALSATNVSVGTLIASTIVGSTSVSSGLLAATNIVGTNISTGTITATTSLFAVGNSNTVGSIYTTGGNVGIGITNPSNTLQIGNATNANILTVTSSGSLGIGTPLPENGFSIAIPNAKLTLLSAGLENVMTRLSIGSGSGHYSAIEGGHLTAGRTSLAFMTCLNATTNSGNPLTRMYITNDGNVGINTTSPSANLDVTGTARFTTSVTSGLLSATNVVGTSISAGTLSATTITGANLSLSGNLSVAGTLTTVNITSTNMLNTNISAGTINATGLSSLANATATNVSTGGLNATGLSALANATVTNVSAGVVIASTGLTTGTINATGLSTLTNATVTNVSTGTLTATGLSALANATVTNVSAGVVIASTGLTTGTINATGTSVLANVTATNVSTGTLTASTGITVASAKISNADITTTSIGTARITSALLALGNSNTMGSIFTTGGNVGINTATPGSALHVAGSIPILPVGNGIHMGIDFNTYASIQLNSTIGSYIDFAAGGIDFSTRIMSMSTGNLNIYNISNTCNVGINNLSPSANLDVVGTIKVSGLSALANVTATNVSTGTLIATTSVTSGLLSATNIIGNSISAGTLSATTITGANLSLSGNLSVAGTLTTVNITSTNMLNTNISAGTINATGFTSLQNVTLTNVSASTLNASTGITTGTIKASGLSSLADISATNISTGGLNATNIYTGGLNATANITVNGAVGSNGSLLVSGIDSYGHALYVASSSAMGKRLAFNNNGTVGWMFSYDYGSNLPQNLILQGPGGNLGIGNDSPIYKLDVSGTGRFAGKLTITGSAGAVGFDTATNDQFAEMRVIRNSTGSVDKDMYLQYEAGATSTLHMFSDNSETMTLKAGKVGINNASPNAPLQFSNTIVNRKLVLFDGQNNDHQYYGLGINDASFRYQIDNVAAAHDFYAATSTTTSRHLMRIKGDGNIGIGTTSPSGMLHLNNAALFTSTGNLTCTGDVISFGSLSDRRLKKNIETIETAKALDIVSKLRAVSFDWKDDIFNEEKRNTSDLGFIAQEVEELIPEAVSEYTQLESGEVYKNIKHERLVPYLLSAIQYLLSKQA